MKQLRTVTIFSLLGFCRLFAQSPGPAFEVASIKPSPPDVQQSMVAPQPGGGLNIEGLSLRTMLTWAYRVRPYQITGGPSWVDSIQWNVLAKSGSETGAVEFEKLSDSERDQS